MSKISELSDGGVIQGGDTLIAVRSGGNVKVTYGGSTTANIDGGTIDGTVIGGSTAAAITGTTITGTSFVSSGNMTFGDNDKAVFGAGSDLQIYHDGSNSYISDQGTGNLTLLGGNFRLRDTTDTTDSILANPANFVKLYYAGDEKLATVSDGINVTGTVKGDSLEIGTNTDGASVEVAGAVTDFTIGALSTGSDLLFSFNRANGNTTIANGTRGSETTRVQIANGGDISFYEDTGTTAKFFWDASAERLGLGTTNPQSVLHINDPVPTITLQEGAGSTTLSGDGAHLTYTVPTGKEHRFKVDTSQAMTIDSSGNVGIGTSSPSNVLHINNSNPTIRLEDSDGSGAGIAQVQNTASGNLRLIADPNNDGAASSTIEFEVDGSERMRIDSSGNILFGATSTSATEYGAKVLKDGSVSEIFAVHRQAADGDFLQFARGGNTIGSIGCGSGALTFDNSSGEAMRIDSSGNLLVGTTSTSASVAGGRILSSGRLVTSVDSDSNYFRRNTTDGNVVTFARDGASVGSISVTSSATTYNTSSDERLKENITDAPAGNVDDIKVRSFDWKVDGSHQDYGMVAQELEAVAPYAVTKGETEDDMWSVDYSKLVPMLIKEIQDLKAEVAALKGAN